MAPTRFGKYEVRERLGQGGFGTVYLAYDPHLKRQVAIKTCTSSDSELRRRFVREAELAAGLRHPHITTVFEFGEQDGAPYLVQEYLPGEDLSAKIARRKPISPERKLRYLLEIARALDHAHARGVVHRDIKPGNIRVLDDDQVKIMDFGIAKLLKEESHLTRTGMTIGTAGYLPPEQILGRAVDQRADIFSFGVLAYELLTFRQPFSGNDISAVFFRILNEEPRPVDDFLPSCPQELADLVRRCVAKEPADRFQSFGPLIADLEVITPWQEVGGKTLESRASVRAFFSGSRTRNAEGTALSIERRTTLGDGFEQSSFLTGLRLRRLSFLWVGLSVASVALTLAGLWSLANWLERREPESSAVHERATEVRTTAFNPEKVTRNPDSPLPTSTGQGQPYQTAQKPIARVGSRADRQHVPGPQVMPAPAQTFEAVGSRVTPPPPAEPGAAREDRLQPPDPIPSNTAPLSSSSAPTAERLPAPKSSLPARPAPRGVLVILAGAAEAGVETAEGALLRELAAAGAQTASIGLQSSAQRDGIVGSAPSDIVALGQRYAADLVVTGRLVSEAEPSLSRFYVGRAVLELRVYEVSTGRQLSSETVQVGGDGKQGKAGASAMAARIAAAQEAGRIAARKVVSTGRLMGSAARSEEGRFERLAIAEEPESRHLV